MKMMDSRRFVRNMVRLRLRCGNARVDLEEPFVSILRELNDFSTAQLPKVSAAYVSLRGDGGFTWRPMLANDWWRKGKLWEPVDVIISNLAGDISVRASTAYDDGGSLPMHLLAGAGSYMCLQDLLGKGETRVALHARTPYPKRFPLTEAAVQALAIRHGLGFPAPIRKLFTSERLASDSVGLLNPISEGFIIQPDREVCHILTLLSGVAFLYYEASPENDGKSDFRLKLYHVDEGEAEYILGKDDDIEGFMLKVLAFIETGPPAGHPYSVICSFLEELLIRT